MANVIKLGGNQAKAVFTLLYDMCAADGTLENDLKEFGGALLTKFFGDSWRKDTKTNDYFGADEAKNMVRGLSEDKKRYVAAILLLAACGDGKLEDAEVKYWKYIKEACELPNMTPKEAVELYKSIG